jgi:hypothetical protein
MPEDTLPLHVRVRIEEREARIQRLGFKSYAEYLRSPEWAEVRRRYRAAPALPQECFCGATEVEFHHTTYERVGRERLEDLVPLCVNCHRMLHALESRGVVGLDYTGFDNPMQAFLYRVERMPMVERAKRESPPDLDGRIARAAEETKARAKARSRARRQRGPRSARLGNRSTP